MEINSLMLRYIDAVEFDFENDSLFEFLKDKLKTEINLSQNLFIETNVNKKPINFDLKFDFQSDNPKGLIFLRFTKGYSKELNKFAILWETVAKTLKEEIPNDLYNIIKWIKDAHELTDDWFFKIIEGELEERFM